ncbi:MAG: YtxH domain-containing protein [Armatimonadetes bacterium]|nr:YtxH domain-containing protein [Armatimonadota bacterium]
MAAFAHGEMAWLQRFLTSLVGLEVEGITRGDANHEGLLGPIMVRVAQNDSEVTHRMDDRRDGIGFVFGLLVGALVGASIAVILAPQSGAETRDTLRSKAHEVKGKAQELMGELKDDAGEWVEKGKQVIGKAFRQEGGQTFSRFEGETTA